MEKLIRFQHESEPNSVALFEAVSAPISCPQIFAGHYRGEDFNLVTDVGSREGKTQKESLFQQGVHWKWHISSWENLATANVCHRDVCLYKLLFKKKKGKPKATQQQN